MAWKPHALWALICRQELQLLYNKMLAASKYLFAAPLHWIQSMKSADLIGHSNIQACQQLDGYSVTRPFLSLWYYSGLGRQVCEHFQYNQTLDWGVVTCIAPVKVFAIEIVAHNR